MILNDNQNEKLNDFLENYFNILQRLDIIEQTILKEVDSLIESSVQNAVPLEDIIEWRDELIFTLRESLRGLT